MGGDQFWTPVPQYLAATPEIRQPLLPAARDRLTTLEEGVGQLAILVAKAQALRASESAPAPKLATLDSFEDAVDRFLQAFQNHAVATENVAAPPASGARRDPSRRDESARRSQQSCSKSGRRISRRSFPSAPSRFAAACGYEPEETKPAQGGNQPRQFRSPRPSPDVSKPETPKPEKWPTKSSSLPMTPSSALRGAAIRACSEPHICGAVVVSKETARGLLLAQSLRNHISRSQGQNLEQPSAKPIAPLGATERPCEEDTMLVGA